jgi:hypothetical protein
MTNTRGAFGLKRSLLAAIVVSAISAAPAAARPAGFAFQPIAMQRINLPRSITSATYPEFAKDGQHLLFWSNRDLWITGLHRGGAHCLSCGLANDPKLSGPGVALLASPFPDGKRVLMEQDIQPGASKLAVLDCAPSLIKCKRPTISPVDYSAAEPAVIPPGGAVTTPQATLVGGEYHAQLSQDGRYVGFSVFRTDAIEEMVVGKLQHAGDKYVVANPKVINPAGPTSSSDTNVDHWSETGALYEFKAFTHGGADATYVEVGGPALDATNVWSVNLATGRRTRLVSAPDWNEDDGVSPNGKLLSVFSDRTMHFTDWLGGLMPVRDFIDAPMSAMAASNIGGNSECEGPMWLLPSTGDHGGNLAGEPLLDYKYHGMHVADNIDAPSQWSPNGTMIALNTMDDPTGNAAPFILVAHLTATKPSQPLPPVTSQPGAWAPSPTGYHPAMGYAGTITLAGPGGGKVTIHYSGGVFSGNWSETYANYSEDGRDFVNGTVTITGPVTGGTYSSHLTMTGANTGSDSTDITFNHGAKGHATATYDGHTITGPMPQQVNATTAGGPATACPRALPKEPALHATATRLPDGDYKVKVTVSIAGMGANETVVSTRPVYHATLKLGNTTIHTNHSGIAIVKASKSHTVTVAAGDTLLPTSVHLSSQTHRSPHATAPRSAAPRPTSTRT